MERTALHYAMGLPSVEELSTILIKAGAKRIVKDLVGSISYLEREEPLTVTVPLEITTTFLLLHEQIGHRETSGRGGEFDEVDSSETLKYSYI